MEVKMITENEIKTIQELLPEEQEVVMSLVNSFKKPKKMNDMQKILKKARQECLSKNPMTMEEIDSIIHDGH